ncbi:MaoC family dehydratase [Haloactinomyces albus]|uniref:Acyl dehydratase n=1 Tax=Haloactinomyces albus TaxID=1352928 RepID=A0AAE3ZH36_9ACTN|nr:MaoC/PaaZ C-terminal domain-containing protein [Haloactinomyces albus]MDR7303975.1 acyl dehydratase [Haloactinomyces albus]
MTGIRVGDELPAYEVTSVSAEKMKTMSALMRDANPIHYDAEAVRALNLGDRVVNQGPLNQAYVVSMLGHWAGGVARVRAIRLRYLGNVFAEDTLRACGTVTAIRAEDGVTVADCDVHLDVVEGSRVLSGTAAVRIGD